MLNLSLKVLILLIIVLHVLIKLTSPLHCILKLQLESSSCFLYFNLKLLLINLVFELKLALESAYFLIPPCKIKFQLCNFPLHFKPLPLTLLLNLLNLSSQCILLMFSCALISQQLMLDRLVLNLQLLIATLDSF